MHPPAHLLTNPTTPARAQAKQALHIGERRFEPTSIEHHWRMLDEVGGFAHDLRQYEKAVRRWEASAHGGCRMLKGGRG